MILTGCPTPVVPCQINLSFDNTHLFNIIMSITKELFKKIFLSNIPAYVRSVAVTVMDIGKRRDEFKFHRSSLS